MSQVISRTDSKVDGTKGSMLLLTLESLIFVKKTHSQSKLRKFIQVSIYIEK